MVFLHGGGEGDYRTCRVISNEQMKEKRRWGMLLRTIGSVPKSNATNFQASGQRQEQI